VSASTAAGKRARSACPFEGHGKTSPSRRGEVPRSGNRT
jgi:hypothetical protein